MPDPLSLDRSFQCVRCITHNISYRTRVEIRSGCITRQCWSSRLSRPDVCEGIPMLCYVSPEGQAILPLILFIINPAYRNRYTLGRRGMGHDKLGNPRKIPAQPVRLHITRGPSNTAMSSVGRAGGHAVVSHGSGSGSPRHQTPVSVE